MAEPTLQFEPTTETAELFAAMRKCMDAFRSFNITAAQRQYFVGAFATGLGANMTFVESVAMPFLWTGLGRSVTIAESTINRLFSEQFGYTFTGDRARAAERFEAASQVIHGQVDRILNNLHRREESLTAYFSVLEDRLHAQPETEAENLSTQVRNRYGARETRQAELIVEGPAPYAAADAPLLDVDVYIELIHASTANALANAVLNQDEIDQMLDQPPDTLEGLTEKIELLEVFAREKHDELEALKPKVVALGRRLAVVQGTAPPEIVEEPKPNKLEPPSAKLGTNRDLRAKLKKLKENFSPNTNFNARLNALNDTITKMEYSDEFDDLMDSLDDWTEL